MTKNSDGMAQLSSSENSYSIVRVDTANANGGTARLWMVYIKRHRKSFVRHFPDGVYGGRASALAMAMAYREALQRLFPPLTMLEHRTKPRSNNKSGIPGVRPRYEKGRLKDWAAFCAGDGQTHQRYFSVKAHGDDGAKALAIATRMEWIAQQSNRFVTVNAQATQVAESRFPQLLAVKSEKGKITFPTVAPPDSVTVNRQLQQLNAWFHALRPQFFHLRLSVYPITSRGYNSLFIVVGNATVPGQLLRKSWTMQHRSYEEVLQLAWEYTQKVAMEQIGLTCWELFQDKYQSTVFESTRKQPLHILHQLDLPQVAALRSQPPPELMPMLEGIHIPALPLDASGAAAS